MPVILHAQDYDRWLDREETERLPLDLLRPFEAEAMEIYEANPKVNNVRNKLLSQEDGRELWDFDQIHLMVSRLIDLDPAEPAFVRSASGWGRSGRRWHSNIIDVQSDLGTCRPEVGTDKTLFSEVVGSALDRSAAWTGVRVLDPANPKYQPLCVSIGEELHVFGVVKHAIHTLP